MTTKSIDTLQKIQDGSLYHACSSPLTAALRPQYPKSLFIHIEPFFNL